MRNLPLGLRTHDPAMRMTKRHSLLLLRYHGGAQARHAMAHRGHNWHVINSTHANPYLDVGPYPRVARCGSESACVRVATRQLAPCHLIAGYPQYPQARARRGRERYLAPNGE